MKLKYINKAIGKIYAIGLSWFQSIYKERVNTLRKIIKAATSVKK